MAKLKSQRNKRKADKFKSRTNTTRSVFAAKRAFSRAVAKKLKTMRRGRVGHTATERKVLEK